ncbi:unnamed protein product [Thlaspi arvense]|uniref:Uncharacterized protein n=1 Tax=Thlaspi arvense TaxID=13288 RepID=A0AAU9RHB6_THLAR|nr:unnamed protein product [Thlaspi arvense]
MRKSGRFSFKRQSSLGTRRNSRRFSFGRQSSLDPIRRSSVGDELSLPDNLDCTIQLLFMASRGDVAGVKDLLDEGIDVNSIDLDGRTALHVAACEGHVEVVNLLLSYKANIDARDRWGSTKTRKTPMAVANPQEVPEYELNPLELQIRRNDGIAKASPSSSL